VALLVGLWLRRGIAGDLPAFGKWMIGLSGGLQAVMLIAGFVLPEDSVPGGRPVALAVAALLSVATAAAVVGHRARRPMVAVVGVTAGLALAFGFAAVKGVPRMAELRSEKAIQPILEAYPDAEIVSHHSLAGGLNFYGRRVVVEEKFIRNIAPRLIGPKVVLVWVESENLGQLEERFRALTGGTEGPWVLHETPERTLVVNRRPE